jgi:hypothetical protein
MVLPGRKSAGQTGHGRSRGGFRLTYALFATGVRPVASISPPVGVPVPSAYFFGDRSTLLCDRHPSGRPCGLSTPFLGPLTGATGATGGFSGCRQRQFVRSQSK